VYDLGLMVSGGEADGDAHARTAQNFEPALSTADLCFTFRGRGTRWVVVLRHASRTADGMRRARSCMTRAHSMPGPILAPVGHMATEMTHAASTGPSNPSARTRGGLFLRAVPDPSLPFSVRRAWQTSHEATRRTMVGVAASLWGSEPSVWRADSGLATALNVSKACRRSAPSAHSSCETSMSAVL